LKLKAVTALLAAPQTALKCAKVSVKY